MDRIKGSRFARESVYLPGTDLVMMGSLLPDGKTSVPFYDVAANRWLVAAMPAMAVATEMIGRFPDVAKY